MELVTTGRLVELEELERQVEPQLVALGRLVGLGPQRMVALGRALGIRTADELREAAAGGPAARGARHRAGDRAEDPRRR